MGDLAARAFSRVVLTNAEDPDGAGCVVPYRVAFYVAGREEALHNAMIMLDDFFLGTDAEAYIGDCLDSNSGRNCKGSNPSATNSSRLPDVGELDLFPLGGGDRS